MATITGESVNSVLKVCNIFQGIDEDRYPDALRCLQGNRRIYKKGHIILSMGDYSKLAGVVISGDLKQIFYDEDGNQITVNHLHSSQIFGAELACSKSMHSQTELHCLTPCEILYLNFDPLFTAQKNPCPLRAQITVNLLKYFVDQIFFLNLRLRILGQRRLRDKIKIYLQSQEQCEDGCINIPLNRNEMADFLYADRSALSRELSRMKKEGILDYEGQDFSILDEAFLNQSLN